LSDIKSNISKEEQIKAIENASDKYYYTKEQEFDDIYKKIVVDETRNYIKPGRILELGYINRIWTEALLEKATTVDIIEAASSHVARAEEDFPEELDKRVVVYKTLFEDYQPQEPYDTILMAGVIKHLPDDRGFLRKARSWLKPDGVIIGCTPNSRSFHRRLGAYMGLELAPDRFNKRDMEVFNLHLYDRFQWRALFLEAGYEVIHLEGVFLKTFSTQQMLYLSGKYDIDKIIKGLQQLGKELQDYAWYLVLVARLPA
jgi:2-polyprenyl-3-methyl-5-hydroxy-6-metoxy-1,4-benzoquinol methylase